LKYLNLTNLDNKSRNRCRNVINRKTEPGLEWAEPIPVKVSLNSSNNCWPTYPIKCGLLLAYKIANIVEDVIHKMW